MARRVLTEYHPMESEMWFQLNAQGIPQVSMGGTLKPLLVPKHPSEAKSKGVQQYMGSTWRSESMSFLEFLRKASQKGEVQKYVRKAHQASRSTESIAAFANAYAPRGGVLVAATLNSRFSDAFYWQWCQLHVPFRNLNDLWHPHAALVPQAYQGFAVSLLLRPDFWRAEENIRADMELEGLQESYMLSNLAMVRAHTTIVDAYIAGDLQDDVDEPPPRMAHMERAHGLGPTNLPIAAEQWHAIETIRKRVEVATSEAWGDEYFGEPPAALPKTPYAVLGPAGSGKSTAVKLAIKEALAAPTPARAIVVCPTAMLASTYRQELPDVDVDTIHGAFRIFRPLEETFDLMGSFDLIVVEELGQLSQKTFERLIALWDYADRRPVLVFLGDFAQLRGMDPSSATDSARWWEVKKFHLREMRRCECPELQWKLELLRSASPSRGDLLNILRGHRAPSWGAQSALGWNRPVDHDTLVAVFQENPETTFVAISRWAVEMANAAALEASFGRRAPDAWVPGDPESDPENYWGPEMISGRPPDLPVHVGMRVTFTKNIHKERDYVNGMQGVVRRIHATGILVETATKKFVMVYPWTDQHGVTFYPVRLGYATTLMKVQGATLDHVTIWLDTPEIEAAGYVALSRVRRDADWKFVGQLAAAHFRPATRPAG